MRIRTPMTTAERHLAELARGPRGTPARPSPNVLKALMGCTEEAVPSASPAMVVSFPRPDNPRRRLLGHGDSPFAPPPFFYVDCPVQYKRLPTTVKELHRTDVKGKSGQEGQSLLQSLPF